MEVRLSAFAVDAAPITNLEFAEFVERGGYRRRDLWSPIGWDHVSSLALTEPAYFRDPVWGAPDMPVTGVCWWEAAAFAAFRGGRLTTEAQWERCCSGPRHSTYPWGDQPPTAALANFAPDGEPLDRRPTLAIAYPRNRSGFGVVDLVGNFAEWCADNYVSPYDIHQTVDPVAYTDERDDHVVRGGSGLHDGEYLRCAARDSFSPTIRDNLIGFRCAYVMSP